MSRVRKAQRISVRASAKTLFLVLAAAVFSVDRPVTAQQSPLPTAGPVSLVPVVMFVADTSGSEQDCSTSGGGGTYDPSNPPVAKTLYDPWTMSNSNQRGSCSRSGGEPATPYNINRMEMIKLAMATLLDANKDGVIDANDEALLKVKIGFLRFGDSVASDNTDTTATSTTTWSAASYGFASNISQVTQLEDTYMVNLTPAFFKPVGSSFGTVWTAVKAMQFTSVGTPSGPAVAAGRWASSLCYKGYKLDANTDGQDDYCALPSGEQDTSTGDDLYYTCRNYYTIFLTDGEPNGGSRNSKIRSTASADAGDGIPIAKDLFNKQLAYSAEATDLTAIHSGWGSRINGTKIRVVDIGVSTDTSVPGTTARAQINCVSFWGSGGTSPGLDANADGDTNPGTMKKTSEVTITPEIGSYPGTTTAGNYCNVDRNYTSTSVQAYNGNGYTANNAIELVSALASILNSVGYGTFSGSAPTISSTQSAGTAVYAAYFDVVPNQLDWKGHLRKYRYDQTNGYVDCDSGSASANPKPCWDAGGRAIYSTQGTVTFGTFGNESGVDTTNMGLFDHPWNTRRIFVPVPDTSMSTSRLAYTSDLTAEKTINVAATYSGRTIENLVGQLSAGVSFPPNPGTILAELGSLTDLYSWAAYATFKDPTHTNDYTDEPLATGTLTTAMQAFFFTAGRPGSTFVGGTTRCSYGLQTPCAADATADGTASPKLGDSFHSRPVVVGPPVGSVSDPDYLGEFFTRSLSMNGTGLEQVVDAGGTAADPCAGVTPCQVKNRRKVVYLAGNDGMVHCFDEATGYELWAFVPIEHLIHLNGARTQRIPFIDANPTVTDVKFPLDATKPHADGKWHTVLVYGNGYGGQFFFALDVTNPVDPVFLWEYRKPDKMGYTIARAAVAQLPATSTPDDGHPGAAVWFTGGVVDNPSATSYDADDATTEPKHIHMFTLRAYSGVKLHDHHTKVIDLADTETATPTVNGLSGEPRPVDAGFKGYADRVYFGDYEGRLWKACNIGNDGEFHLDGLSNGPFFDPALYDKPSPATAPGYPTNASTPLSGVTDHVADRKALRGPIFFAPDVTYDVNGNLQVAFGSGDMNNPVTQPAQYKNFVWVVRDDKNNDCALPQASVCTAAAGSYTFPDGGTFASVRKLNDLLTAAPLFFNKYLLYGEFQIVPGCPTTYASRLYAVDAFTCGTPGTMPFPGNTNVITYANQLISGIDVQPTGTVFAMGSRPGSNPPNAIAVPGLPPGVSFAGFRQP